MRQIAPLLVTECFAVGDEQLQVARVRLVGGRKVNFINDPVRKRAAGVIRGAETLLRTARPARLNTGRARGVRRMDVGDPR